MNNSPNYALNKIKHHGLCNPEVQCDSHKDSTVVPILSQIIQINSTVILLSAIKHQDS